MSLASAVDQALGVLVFIALVHLAFGLVYLVMRRADSEERGGDGA